MKLNEMLINSTIQDLVVIEDDIPKTDSLKIARDFGKEHKHVLRAIREQILPYISKEFNESNFGLVDYADTKGEKRPMYKLTRSAFVLVVMGFSGSKAMQFKEAYITAFDKLEEALRGKYAPLKQEEMLDRVASRLSSQLFPSFAKTFVKAIIPQLTEGVIEQLRRLPQTETLIPLPNQSPLPEPTEQPSFENLPLVLKVDDIATILRIGRVQAYNLVRQKDFPVIKVGRRLLIPKDQFLIWLNRSTNALVQK